MGVFELNQLQYRNERFSPFRLYIYNEDGYHRGGVWFEAKPEFDEITSKQAFERVQGALTLGLEVRITDAADLLLFHAKGGKILFPPDVEQFWVDVGAK